MLIVTLRATLVALFILGLLSTATAQPTPPEGPPPEAKEAPVTPPRLKSQVQPSYPEAALKSRVEASVVLQIDIDDTGEVEAVTLLEPIPKNARDMGFESAALEAARQWTFEPARQRGKAVSVRISYTLHFKLPAPPQPTTNAPEHTRSNFTGQILERGTREPLVGTRVLVFQGEGSQAQGFEAQTDAEGRFSFYDLDDGQWQVLVETEGYYPLRTREQITTHERLEVLYRLERTAYNLFDVLIEEDRNNNLVTRRQVKVEEMEHMPGTYGDPLKVLRTLPGVAQTNVFTPDIVIRGGTPKDTRFFTMGLQVPAVFHFGGIRGLFPEGMIDTLVLYPGDFPVRYGRSIGGVIDIVMPDRVGEQAHGYLDVSLLDSTFYLELPASEEVWVAGSARRSYYDAVVGGIGVAVEEDLLLPRYWDAHLQVGWRPTPEDNLTFFVFSADHDFVLYSLKDEPEVDESSLPELSMFQLGVNHNWVPNHHLEWTSALLVGWDRNLELGTASGLSFIPPDLTGQRIETRTLRTAGRSEVLARLGQSTHIRLGLDAVWSDVTLNIEPDPSNVTIDASGEPVGAVPDALQMEFDPTFLEIAGYLELELAWPDAGIKAIPGARVDHLGQIDATSFDPRFRLQFDPHPDWTFRGAIGLMHQPPRTLEIQLTLVESDLKPEQALQTSAGATWRPLPALELEVLGFYKKLDNLIYLQDDSQFIWSNNASGRAYGVEGLVRWPLRARFNGWVAYTLSRAERWDPQTRRYDLYTYDQTHNLTAFGAYRLPYNWSLGARFRYATGFPAYNSLGVSDGRVEDFHQLDVRIDKTWVYDTWTLLAYFDIQNVYNRFTPTDTDSNSDSAESPVIAPGVPILPIIGAKGEF